METIHLKVDRSSYELGYGLDEGGLRRFGQYLSDERLAVFEFVCMPEQALIEKGPIQEHGTGCASKKRPSSVIAEDSQRPKRQVLQLTMISSLKHHGKTVLEDTDPIDGPGMEGRPVIESEECGSPAKKSVTADLGPSSSSLTVASTVCTNPLSSSQPTASSENRSKHVASDTRVNDDAHAVEPETRLTSSISRLIMKQRELIRSKLKSLATRLEPVRDKTADDDTLRRQKSCLANIEMVRDNFDDMVTDIDEDLIDSELQQLKAAAIWDALTDLQGDMMAQQSAARRDAGC